jgi:hypothetical protein
MFSRQFEAFHGLSPEQYLGGMSKSTIGKEVFVHNSPQERDEWIKQNLGEHHVARPYGEHLDQVLSASPNIAKTLSAYRHDPTETLSRLDPLLVARDLRDLTHEMATNARPNDKTLYRGAERHPIEDAENNAPISFSENRGAANAFARSTSRGRVFQVAKNMVTGLRMEDYGVTPKTVGPRNVSEAEWLVDPVSFRSSRGFTTK